MLYVSRLSGSRVDEYRKDPRIAIRHVDISCEILRSGNRSALGMDASFQGRTRAEGGEGTGFAAYGQGSHPCIGIGTAAHDGQELHEGFRADSILRRKTATVFDDGILDSYSSATPVVAQEVLAVMDRARKRVTRT